MLSKNHIKSRPVKKVGFFCYQCGRDDFGLNQKSLNTNHDNNVDVTAEEGCADGYLEDYDLQIHKDFPFQDTNIEIHTDTSLLDTAFIETNVIDHSIIPSTEDSAIPYDPNCVMPLSYCFQLDLIHALSKLSL